MQQQEPSQTPIQPTPPPGSPLQQQDESNIAVLIWIGTFFLWFIAPLIGYLLADGKPLVRAHTVAALNYSITALLAVLVAFVMSFFLIGLLFYIAIFIWAVVACIKGALAAKKSLPYTPPLTLTLLK